MATGGARPEAGRPVTRCHDHKARSHPLEEVGQKARARA